MSDNRLTLIPVDPTFVPDSRAERAALETLRPLVPDAEDIVVRRSELSVFVGAGTNFESVACPMCSADIPVRWWQAAMDNAATGDFKQLAVMTPCCAAESTLNDLAYNWPQGFARWTLEVMNPARGRLTGSEFRDLSQSARLELREVWTHI